jgi:N-carbamoylputrescine amidase
MASNGAQRAQMKVTVCQIDPRPGHIERCLVALGEHVAAQSSDFVLLPEMCFSPWLAADPVPDASRWTRAVTEHDRRIASLGDLGARAVLGTRPTVTGTSSRRNQAYLWLERNGRAEAVRDKYHLPDEEGYWERTLYDRGPKRFNATRALGVRIGVQICTEMWFFEWARRYAAERVELLCVPRATPRGSTGKWLAGGRAAAVCAGAYCVSSNLWLPPGDAADCGGVSWIIDPDGHVLAKTDQTVPFATVDVDLDLARASKSTYPRYVRD